MSYTYECNVVCDICGDAAISAGVDETPIDAKEATRRKAERLGWLNEYADHWVCEECLKKLTKSP